MNVFVKHSYILWQAPPLGYSVRESPFQAFSYLHEALWLNSSEQNISNNTMYKVCLHQQSKNICIGHTLSHFQSLVQRYSLVQMNVPRQHSRNSGGSKITESWVLDWPNIENCF